MLIRHTKRRLPRRFCRLSYGHRIVAEADLAPFATHLRAKLVVFSSRTAMRDFWRRRTGEGQPRFSMAMCWSGTTDGTLWLVDRRYFCVISLCRGWLDTNTIVHESVHAAFAYSKRVRGFYFPGKETDEERVCYPAGDITVSVNNFLHQAGLIVR